MSQRVGGGSRAQLQRIFQVDQSSDGAESAAASADTESAARSAEVPVSSVLIAVPSRSVSLRCSSHPYAAQSLYRVAPSCLPCSRHVASIHRTRSLERASPFELVAGRPGLGSQAVFRAAVPMLACRTRACAHGRIAPSASLSREFLALHPGDS